MAQTLNEILIKAQIIDDRQGEAAQRRARSLSGPHFVQSVAALGYATESGIARTIGVELGLPRADLTATPPETEAVALLDLKTCLDRFILPLALREGGELLWLAMADPTDAETLGLVRQRTRKRVRPVAAGPSEISRAAVRIYGSSPLSRLARQLGVEVPPELARRHGLSLASDEQQEDRTGPLPGGEERTDPVHPVAPRRLRDDLSPQDLRTLEAVRVSLEKGGQVLRAIADLCVEKGLIAPAELRRLRTS